MRSHNSNVVGFPCDLCKFIFFFFFILSIFVLTASQSQREKPQSQEFKLEASESQVLRVKLYCKELQASFENAIFVGQVKLPVRR